MYSLIYSDPPWPYPDRPVSNGGCTYQRMTMEQLAELRPLLDSWASPEWCVLAMWFTGPFLPEAVELGKAWGFEWVTVLMTWCKTVGHPDQLRLLTPDETDDWNVHAGPGRYSKHATEYLGMWRRGSVPVPADLTIRQVIHAPVRQHSRKPPEARRRLELLWPDATRMEMFSRENSPGWDVHGNEVGKLDGVA